jgi:hypothetical protein
VLNKIDNSNEKIPIMAGMLDKFDELVARGKELEVKNNAYIDRCIDTGLTKVIAFTEIFVVFTHSVDLCGEIANRALDESSRVTFTMVIYPNKYRNGYCVSLRSRPGFKVSEVAKLFDGGGHECAAGFRIDNVHDIFRVLHDKGIPKTSYTNTDD